MAKRLNNTASDTWVTTRSRGGSGKLSDERVRRAKATDKPLTLSDGQGLHLVVRPSGVKVWFLSYRARSNRKLRKLTIGRYPDVSLAQARDIASVKRGQVAGGGDPVKEMQQARVAAKAASEPFRAVVDLYVVQHVEKLRSSYEITRCINQNFVSRWGDWPLADITRKDVRRAIDEIEARAPVMAYNAFVTLHHLFRWALEREHISQHPMDGMQRPKPAQARDRVLTDAELKQVWEKVGELPYDGYRDIVRLLALTGTRRSEISELRWSEVDIEGKQLVLPRERTKMSMKHIVPLSDLALGLLEDLSKSYDHRTSRVFAPVGRWSRPKLMLDGLLPEMPAWVLHDIRRTVASGLQGLGVIPPIIEAVLGHAVGGERGGGVRRVYQRYPYTREARQALDLWAEHVEQVLQGKSGKVVALRR